MTQTWHQLLFAHWQVEPRQLAPHIPSPLRLDVFEGKAWASLVALGITDARLRLMPAVPFMSTFPELNSRTYVTFGGKPGVYFFSLDATSLPAVKGARTFYHLP